MTETATLEIGIRDALAAGRGVAVAIEGVDGWHEIVSLRSTGGALSAETTGGAEMLFAARRLAAARLLAPREAQAFGFQSTPRETDIAGY